MASHLDIHYKAGAIVEQDIRMLKKSGNNKTPKIIDICHLINDNLLKDITREANDLALYLYTNNFSGHTLIENIDTKGKIEIGKMGINKTFSKNVPIEKIPTSNKLKEILEQGIYFKTTYNLKDICGIRYHHFLAPIRIDNSEENVFVRIVVKEYTKDKNMNNKFYYHQLEYI